MAEQLHAWKGVSRSSLVEDDVCGNTASLNLGGEKRVLVRAAPVRRV